MNNRKGIDITGAIIVFAPDMGVGIQYEEHSLSLHGGYVYDSDEAKALAIQIKDLYEPHCKTRCGFYLKCVYGLNYTENRLYLRTTLGTSI